MVWTWRALFGRWGVLSIFASGEMMEARRAKDVALGYIRKPYEVRTVLRSVEVARALMAGGTPGAVPRGFELFSAAGYRRGTAPRAPVSAGRRGSPGGPPSGRRR